MSVDDLKNKAMQAAMEFMSSERGQKLMNDPSVQRAVGSAFQASVAAKAQWDDAKKQVAGLFNLATEDDLRDMKRNLDRLERRLKRMQREKEELAAERDELIASQAREELEPEPPKRSSRSKKAEEPSEDGSAE